MQRRFVFTLGLLTLSASTFAQNPATGFPPYGSFDNGQFDVVNLQNLNFNFAIPILKSPGRGLDFRFSVFYNSLSWVPVASAWTPVSTSNWGWQLSSPTGQITYHFLHGRSRCGFIDGIPYYRSTTTYDTYRYVDPAGTVHAFSVYWQEVVDDCAGTDTISGAFIGYATDGSGYYADVGSLGSPTAPLIINSAGISVGNSGMGDPNGNFVTSSSPQSGETDWTDSAGHVALKIITGTASIQYKVLDPTGNYQTTTVNLTTLNIKTNFQCGGIIDYTGTANLPQSIVLPNGQQYQFAYEPTPQNSGYYTGRLQQVTLPTGGTIQYTNQTLYCSDGSALGLGRTLNDGLNPASSWSYLRGVNPDGSSYTQVSSPKPPYGVTGSTTHVNFDSAGQETSRNLTDYNSPNSAIRTINTTWAGNGTPSTQTVILDDNTTQSEIETTFDSYGNLQVLKEHDWGTGSPGPVVRTTNISYLNTSPYTAWNIVNRPTSTSIADATGTLQSLQNISYDQSGYINVNCVPNTSCTYTTRGNATAITTYANASNQTGAVTRHVKYDSAGNVVALDIDGTQQRLLAYSSTTNYSYPDSVTVGPPSGIQLTTNFTYNAYTGKLASVKDPNNQTTSFTYDFMKRPKTVTRPDGAQITYGYVDATPPAQSQVTITTPIVQGTSGVTQTISYDGLARPLQRSVQDASQNTYSIVQTVYDPIGRPYKVSNSFTGTASYWTEDDFDVLDRVTKHIMPDGSQTTYAFSTNSVILTDPAGKQLKTISDALGRTSAVYEPDPNNSNQLIQSTSYGYTISGSPVSINEGQQARTYVYDGLARLTKVTAPEAGTVQFQYNDLSLMTQRTDARGVVTNYSYDTLNRRTGISYTLPQGSQVALMPNVCNPVAGQTTPVDNVCFYYDEGGAAANALGRLTHMSYASGNQQNSTAVTETYQQDLMGRVSQDQLSAGGQTYTLSYNYNNAGELTAITYPSNRIVQQSYDPIGRLAKIADAGTTYLTVAASGGYNAANELLSVSYGSGVAGNFQYSPDRLQLTNVSYTKGATTLFGLTYGYGSSGSNNGQISGITDNVDNGRTISYTYDALGRITNATTVGSTNYPKWGLSWTYDRYGNRAAQSISSGCVAPMACPTNSVTVSPTTNQITGSPYAYDLGGNMTNDGLNTLTYDGENRAVGSTGSLGSATYVYDGNGLRVQKTSGVNTTFYIFSGTNVIAEYVSGAAPASPTIEYISSGTQVLATIAGSTTTYQLADHLSVRVNTDSSGNILKDSQGNDIGSQGHFPFGETWYIGSASSKWEFTSYERDSESANDYALARFHVNRLGRFSSADLLAGDISDPQSLNRYAYVLNDPCDFVDPTGLRCTLKLGLMGQTLDPAAKTRITDIFGAAGVDVQFVANGPADYYIWQNVPLPGAAGDASTGIALINNLAIAQQVLRANAGLTTNLFASGAALGMIISHEIGHLAIPCTHGGSPDCGNTGLMKPGGDAGLTAFLDPKLQIVDPSASQFTAPQATAIQDDCNRRRKKEQRKPRSSGGGGGPTGSGPIVSWTFYTVCNEGGCSTVITGAFVYWPLPPSRFPTL